MPKEHINPQALFPSLQHGFSQIVVASGKRTAYISGQTAWDAQKQIVGGDSLLEQTRQALRNVQSAVEAVGGTLRDVVSLRVYIVNYKSPESAAAVGIAMREFFSEEKPPASTWIGVAALAMPEFLIEIEAIAVLD